MVRIPLWITRGKEVHLNRLKLAKRDRERQQSAAVEKEVYAMSLSNTTHPIGLKKGGLKKGEIRDNPASGRPPEGKVYCGHFWRT